MATEDKTTNVATRANAVAREQEMRALTKENQAAVVMAEAEIPKSMASAYEKGTLRATHNGEVRG